MGSIFSLLDLIDRNPMSSVVILVTPVMLVLANPHYVHVLAEGVSATSERLSAVAVHRACPFSPQTHRLPPPALIVPHRQALSSRMTNRVRGMPLLILAVLNFLALGVVVSVRYYRQRYHVLGVATQAYVISLPRRDTRRTDMQRLAKMMGTSWNFVDATDMTDSAVSRIFSNVRHTRESALADLDHGSYTQLSDEIDIPFDWPEDIDYLAAGDSHIPSASSDLWPSLSVNSPPTPWQMACAEYDFTLSPYTSSTPNWLVLTPPRVACWQSHVSVIRRIVDEGRDGPFIILEDDVDMEKDTARRLRDLWPLLPSDWDVVFLGRCTSAISVTHLTHIRRSLLVERSAPPATQS